MQRVMLDCTESEEIAINNSTGIMWHNLHKDYFLDDNIITIFISLDLITVF